MKRHRKKQLYVRNQPRAAAELFAQDRFAEEIGVTRETLWRWRRDGLLKTININGRHYVTAEEAADFKRRALAGQFAKAAMRPARLGPTSEGPGQQRQRPSVAAANKTKEVSDETK